MLGRLRCARPATGAKTRNTRRYPHALHPYPESRPADLRRLRAVRFAQDSSTTDTASGKHFAVVGGISLLEPKNDPITGVKKTDGGPAPTVSFSYYINDNWALSCGALRQVDNKFKGPNNARLGSVEQQPVALSGQYHFGQADNVFRPFVGVGYYQSSFSNEKLGNGADTDIRFKDAKGVIGTVSAST